MGRSVWVERDTVRVLLALLTVENRLALELSLRCGMRIGDVLATRRQDVENGAWSYREQKTGKRRRVHIGKDLQIELLKICGKVYVFEHRTDWRRHRTRQAVWKDLHRAAKLLKLKGTVSPHSARKVYAVEMYHRSGRDLEKVRRLLNHEDEAVTLLYALADEMSA